MIELVKILPILFAAYSLGDAANDTTAGLAMGPTLATNGTIKNINPRCPFVYNIHCSCPGCQENHPLDYLVISGIGAIKLHVSRVNFTEARQICNEEGGHLATIESELEEKQMKKMIIEANISYAWIGVHDLFENLSWVTMQGLPLECMGRVKWAPGEPNNYGGKEHCVFVANAGMYDHGCEKVMPFFCKRSLQC